MNELEEIKAKINIVDYVGSYVSLKQAGRNYKGICPFHSEKTPSFMVSPERQIWHCFGACNEGGDIFSFAQKIESLTFPEAVELLAQRAGVKLKKDSFKKESSKSPLYSANELATEYYHSLLLKSDGAKEALNYLKETRGIKEKTINEFALGYSPLGKNDLSNELKKHNLSPETLAKAGLASKKPVSGKNNNFEWRDFFWGRLMFPIRDTQGRTIGFSARIMGDGLPKYINTPETEIYHKSSVLYGIDLAKETIRKADNAIIVEGMMDVIASYQAGVKNVVAPGGTALTENQLRLIGRFTKNLKFAFDIDFAGSKATRRAIEIAWKEGFNIKVIEVPKGKDPADAVLESPKMWLDAVKNAKYVVDYLFEEAFKRNDKNDPIGRKKIAAELLPVIKRISDDIEKNGYVKKLAEELKVDPKSIFLALEKVGQDKSKNLQPETKKSEPTPKNNSELLEKNVLGLLISFPHYLDFAQTLISGQDFENSSLGKKYESVIKYYLAKGKFKESAFLNSLKKEEKDEFNHITLAAEASYEDFDEEKKAEEIYHGVKRIKKQSILKKKQALTEEISLLEKKKDNKGAKEALKILKELIEEESTLS